MYSPILEQHVVETLRHYDATTGSLSRRHREEWLLAREANRQSRRQALVHWAGDRLVAAGEALRARPATAAGEHGRVAR